LRIVLSTLLLLALAMHQPCFAKEAHAQHGARATAASAKGAAAKGAGVKSTNSKDASAKVTNFTRAKTNSVVDPEAIVAPPVLPGKTPQRNPSLSPSVKIAPPNAVRGHPAATLQPLRNAIGQPIAQPKNLIARPPQVSTPVLQRPGTMSLVGVARGASGAPTISSPNLARAPTTASVATLSNRGGINGAGVIRTAGAPSIIGGPARQSYGINGTTVQNKH
jgi:hypothetical protein